jgi:MOSC domain-containing protein YiiM
MAQLMQNSGKTGWLYRVVAGGQVSSDAPLELVSRLSDVSVHEAGPLPGRCRLMMNSTIAYCRRRGCR